MIKFSKLDEKLSIFKNKKIVIWGAGVYGRYMFNLLTKQNLNIYCFCDSYKYKEESLFLEKKIISPEQLGEEYSKSKNIIVQLAVNQVFEKEIINKLEELKVTDYIQTEETLCRLTFLNRRNNLLNSVFHQDLIKEIDKLHFNKNIQFQLYNYIMSEKQEYILLCMPEKTGDHTLMGTFDLGGKKVFNLWHCLDVMSKKWLQELCKNGHKIKIITAVRDPIAQNISSLFQNLLLEEYNAFLLEDQFWEGGGDIQGLFDKLIQYKYLKNTVDLNPYTCAMLDGNSAFAQLIQDFIPSFCDNYFDFWGYTFDKETGYAIYEENNIEVFVYQIEKLNSIYKILLNWLGIDSDISLQNRNVTTDKWISEAYKDALENIRFSEQYYKKCFSEKYVKHFYNEGDIQKMKEKWKKHIY